MLWPGHDACSRLTGVVKPAHGLETTPRYPSTDRRASIPQPNRTTAQSDSPCHAAAIPADTSHDSARFWAFNDVTDADAPCIIPRKFWAFSHYGEDRSPGSGHIHTMKTRLRASSWYPYAQNPAYDTRMPRITGRDMPRTDRAVVPHDANMPKTAKIVFFMG